MVPDKYALTRDEEDNLIEKNFAQLVYMAGKYEHLSTTLLDTQAILEDLSVAHVKPSEIQVVLNLKDAYRYAASFQRLEDINFSVLLKINLLIKGAGAAEAGQIRTQDVIVPLSNETYQPVIPNKEQAEKDVQEIFQGETTTTDKALTLMLWLSRTQLFMDGNKRTAIVAANVLMFADKRGLITVPENKMHWYSWQLQKYYKNGDTANLKHWLYDNAVFGLGA